MCQLTSALTLKLTRTGSRMNKLASNLGRVQIAFVVLLILVCSWYPPIQSLANEQVDAGLKRALISFASARTLNALISVVQGTELSVQPLGVGITLTLGQVLDPVNDLIEQFSAVMLVASVSFGIQKALLAIGAHWAISVLVSACAIMWGVLFYLQKCPTWLTRAVLVLVMVRFAIPAVTLGSDLIFREMMAKDYQQHQESLDLTAKEVAKSTPQQTNTPAPGEEKNWLEKLKERLTGSLPSVNVNVDSIKKSVEQVPEKIIRLTVIFVLQTVLIPIILMWALYVIVLGAVRPSKRVPNLS